MRCENCCYFAQTDNPDWKGKEHCCFTEWGHQDYEIAPCDDPYFDDEQN